MTDKEKLEAIRAEIHRLVDVCGYDREMANALFSFMDSLPNEHVSELLNIESMIESYKQRLISQTNGVKNSSFIDMCLASYKHGINETLDTLNLSNVERIGKNWKELVSEDLEKAARKYAGIPEDSPHDLKYCVQDKKAKYDAVLYGANWQKQQMMAKAVDVTIAIPYQNSEGGYTQLVDSKKGLPFGDNIKVLVIKED